MQPVLPDDDHCYRAVLSRDARFDGWFFTAVTSTGIYCRPSCPARTPKRANVRFYPSAAAAQRAGFRACKRCRPDAAPGSPEWRWRADVVGRAMRLIADGVIDREGVGGVAERVGYSRRQLQRLLVAEVGAGPLALARAQRAQTARILIETTDVPFTQVAFASGFASVRQFNDTVRSVFGVAPSTLRAARRPRGAPAPGALDLRLSFRPPFDAAGIFGFLAARAVEGVENGGATSFRRTLRLDHGAGVTEVAVVAGRTYLNCRLWLEDLRDLASGVQACRRLFDLDADPVAVDAQLGRDPLLAAAVRHAPGRRVPGTVDGAELAVRAVFGQQVSVVSARRSLGRLVARFGKPLTAPDGSLTHLFPTPDALAGSDPRSLGVPQGRGGALIALCEALAAGDLHLDPGADREDARRRLAAIPGIGSWTAGYVAMRALGDPDGYPAGDAAVRRALDDFGLDRPGAHDATERWRPWRAYAVAHLWAPPISSRPRHRTKEHA